MGNTIRQVLTLTAIACLPLMVHWRIALVDSKIGSGYGLDGVYDTAIMHADGPLLASIGLLLLGSWFVRHYALGVLIRAIILILVLLYLTDLIVYQQFGIRILFSSIQLYGSQGLVIWEQLQTFLGGTWKAWSKALLFLVFAAALLFAPRKPWKATVILCGLLTLSATIVSLMPWKLNYVNSWALQNFLDANIFTPNTRTYSEPYIDRLSSGDAPPEVCGTGLAQDRNVILLIVESLSSYQSRVFGGTVDWTPDLDELSAEALVFDHMHANGFSTNEGLIGILGGVRLYSPFSHLFRAVIPFETAWGIEETLPREFNRAGYHTAFLTLGSLKITRKGDWIEDIGFDEIEGSEHPFYEDWPRVQYSAAPDAALYARSLEWIADRPPAQPWLLTLLTISTHQPFRDPETMASDLERTVRYADREAAKFIRKLKTSGFFEDGLLLVLGDHRSMTYVSEAEERTFGRSAPARVQFLLFGQETAGRHDGIFHHSDLVPSFRHWLNSEYCMPEPPASIFSKESRGRCALHVRGSHPSLVDVFCPDGQGLVELNGDATEFLESDGLPEEQQADILRLVARERLAGQRRHQDFIRSGAR